MKGVLLLCAASGVVGFNKQFADWYESKGGSMKNVNMGFGPHPTKPDVTLRGLWTTGDLKKDEVFAKIPMEAMLTGTDHCVATWNVVQQMRLNRQNKSTHGPYVDEMEAHEFLMPEMWTTDDLQIMNYISPHDIGRHAKYFRVTCENKPDIGTIQGCNT